MHSHSSGTQQQTSTDEKAENAVMMYSTHVLDVMTRILTGGPELS